MILYLTESKLIFILNNSSIQTIQNFIENTNCSAIFAAYSILKHLSYIMNVQ